MFPAKATFPVDIFTPGRPIIDRFGNEIPGPGEWKSVLVLSWWVDRSEEKGEDSVLRTIDYLHVHVSPKKAPPAGGQIRTPDGRVWQVEGNPEDYEHGFHGWAPGFVVVNGKEVAG